MSLPRLVLAVILSVAAFVSPMNANAQACDEPGCSEFLVKFSRQVSEEEIGEILREHALEVVGYFEASRIYHLQGDGSAAPEDVLEKLNAEEKVTYAEPNYDIQADAVPNDPRYPELWALNNSGQYDGAIAGADIGMESVWNSLTQPDSVTVAVLDSGIDYDHEDLAANMWRNAGEVRGNGKDDDGNGYVDDYYGYDFANGDGDPYDDYFHGTHVAGTIGAVANNGIGIAGINWNVKLMALKFMKSSGVGSLSDAIEAIDYAVENGAKVINNSWDFYLAGTSGLPTNPALEPVQSLRDAIAAADAAGVICVAAAGNNGMNADSYPTYPGAYSVGNIMSVAATDVDDSLPDFSNYGKISVDLGAPGVLIESTYPTWKENPPYHFLSGTSMAAPHVTGAAALYWAEDPNLTHRQVIDGIFQGVKPLSDLSGKTTTGGRLDLAGTFAMHFEGDNHAPVASAGSAQYRTQGETVTLQGSATDADGDSPLTYLWTLVTPAGETKSLGGSKISFVADLIGTYSASLIVSDGQDSGLASTVKVYVAAPTTTNAAPTASAGPSQLRRIGDVVLLQGKGTDANGDTLTYKWTLSVPAGSKATLSGSTKATASFTADIIGTFIATLTVSDGKATATSSAKVYVTEQTTTNTAPIASAGPNQLRRIGDVVLLQGKGTDANGDALTYKWTLSVPAGSKSALSGSTSATASFTADTLGTYSATLTVSDGKTSSAPATAKIYTLNAVATSESYDVRFSTADREFPTQAVVIDAQAEGALDSLSPELGGQVELGETLILDGSESTISGSDSLDYEWIFVEKPAGSESVIENADQGVATFVPDVEGRYTVQLTVNSGKITLYAERAFLARENVPALVEGDPADDGAQEGQPAETASSDAPTAMPGGCSLNTN